MPPTITTSVLTSKVAQDHLGKIRAEHADMMQGIQDQALKVGAYNQQKAAEQAQTALAQAEADKQMQLANTQAEKDRTMAALKQQEIDIKRAALSAE